MTEKPKYPAPVRQSRDGAFLGSPKQGKFLIKRCLACKEPHYFPRSICPFCFFRQDRMGREQGRGQNLQLQPDAQVLRQDRMRSVTSRSMKARRLLTNFVDCDLSALKIGQRVKVVFKPTDGAPLRSLRRWANDKNKSEETCRSTTTR